MDSDSRDAALMARLANSDQTAMKVLVERYKAKAYYLALGMVGNKDEALDISQEAFLRVYRSAKKFLPGSDFFPWFYAIIANLCRDCLARRERKEKGTVDIAEYDFLEAENCDPEQKLIQDEEILRVRGALMLMDFEDREILMLKHFRDLSYEEIAALLKIPRGTVMSRLYYARKKLAKLLEEKAAS